MGAVASSALSVVVCVAGCISVLPGCPWHRCSASLLLEPAKGKLAAVSLSLGADRPGRRPTPWAGDPGHWAGFQRPCRTMLGGIGLYWIMKNAIRAILASLHCFSYC